MSGSQSTSSAVPAVVGRGRSRARAAAATALVGLAVVGLSGCRTLEDSSKNASRAGDAVSTEVASGAPRSAAEAPVPAPGTPAPGGETPQLGDPLAVAKAREEAQAGAAAAREQSGGDRIDDAVADTARAEAVAAAQAPEAGAVAAERAESGPAKPIDPWRLVGQPYLVDDESPQVAADGLTTYTLWFRTKGEFRGVRQGTSITDDRHYKVGLITFPELPGYVPGGVGMLQRSDAMVRKGRYCYTAEVHLEGRRGDKRFPIRRNGAELQVEMDLRGAPVQRRTVTVVVRDEVSEDPPITPVEEALACR